MNLTVELVKLWGEYEVQNPGGTIEDFCRSHLAGKIRTKTRKLENNLLQPDLNGRLIKMLSRIGKFQEIYANKALAGTGLNQIEEFGILIAIFNLKEPIKSEAIFNNMLELSSGVNILNRLKTRNLVTEYTDPDDRRVKRLRITPKGEKSLINAKQQILKVVGMLTQGLTDDDKHLCLEILNPIDSRFTLLIRKQKNKTFEEIYLENCS